MKANVFFKAVCVAVVMIASTVVVKAGNPHYTNDVINGESVTTRFVYKNDNGLHYHLKYSFTYDQENRLVSKETFGWNTEMQQWTPQYHTYYSYIGSEIVVESDSWNSKTQAYEKQMNQNFFDIHTSGLTIAMVSKK